MKKLLFILALTLSANAWAGTFTMWGKATSTSQWIQLSTYMDFGSCENARRTVQYSYHETRCVAD